MTPEPSPSPSGLLARKGTAVPLGLRRPQGPSDDELEAKDAEAKAGPDTLEAETGGEEQPVPVQLNLVSDMDGEEPEKRAEDPPPPASLLPFSLRRERRESGETWELVSSEIFERMSGMANEAPPAETPPAETPPAETSTAEAPASAAPDSADSEAPEAPEAEAPEAKAPEAKAPDVETDEAAPLEAEAATETAEPTVVPKAAAEPAPSEPSDAAPDAPDTASEAEAEPEPEPGAAPEEAADPSPAPTREAEVIWRDPKVTLGGAAAESIVKHVKPVDVTPRATPAPVADPAWRLTADKALAAERAGAGRWILLGGAGCLLIAGIAWWSYSTQSPTPTAPPVAAGGEAAPVPQDPPAPSAEQAAPSPAPAAETQSAARPEPETGPSVPPETALEVPPAAEIGPSVDLVRIEPDGNAVIAGRAAPHSELIVLDNGIPIGTVKADAFGEWVFVPDQPLSEDRHEFGLVVKSVQGTVAVPAGAAEEEAPAGDPPAAGEGVPQAAPKPGDGAALRIEDGDSSTPVPSRKPPGASNKDASNQDASEASDLRVPIPARKPETEPDRTGASQTGEGEPSGAGDDLGLRAAGSDFVVQLASVKTRDGARQEWAKLQSRFPEVLEGMNLNLDETKLPQKGTVVRVRTGPFPDLSEAVSFCQRLRAGRQDCLIVRTNARTLSMIEPPAR